MSHHVESVNESCRISMSHMNKFEVIEKQFFQMLLGLKEVKIIAQK